MTENEIAKEVVDVAYQVHTELGPGLLESVYEIILCHELQQRGLETERQMPVPIRYKSIVFEEGFRPDIIVEDKVLIEVKSVAKTHPVHKKQLLTYLRLMDRRLGRVANVGEGLIRGGINRVVNGLEE